MRIAIIGSGVAGLSAAYALGSQHHVTLYERQPALGMDAHAVEIDNARVDVPLRVMYRGHYRTLTRMYDEAGVITKKVNYASSYSTLYGETYFHFQNMRLGPLSLPLVGGARVFDSTFREIALGALRFFNRADYHALPHPDMTFGDYLRWQGYSETFITQFVLPVYSTICTCSYDSVCEYPAEVIFDFMRNVRYEPALRVVGGVQMAVNHMASKAQEIKVNTTVCSVTRHAEGVTVIDDHGDEQTFDHLILATQANHAQNILTDATDAERHMLSGFRYEPSRVITHQDPSLMPHDQKRWLPLNLIYSPEHDMPMTSVYMNRIVPELKGKAPVFQTWNPVIEPAAESVIQESRFERPVVNRQSQKALAQLEALHAEANRRVWFCGAYAAYGIPLQESGATSAHNIAQKIL